MTRRQTRKGSKKLADDDRADQIAGFQAAEIAKFAPGCAKMTNEEKEDEIASVRKQLGILPRKPPNVKPPDVDEGPYEVDTTKETEMTKQAAAPTPEDTIDIVDDNDNDDEDEEEYNTLHPRTARKQGCENHPEELLFSDDSDDDHDDNDPDDDYSQSAYDDNKKKKSKRKTPKSTIRIPRKTHWSGNPSPDAQEAATVLVAIGATRTVASFMVATGLDEITEIQQWKRATISLYAKNSRKNLPQSDIFSTRFILDLE